MSNGYKFFNRNVLYFISVFFIFITIVRIYYSYNSVKEYEFSYAQKEAEALKSYAMAHRNYYQELYINNVIPLNEETVYGLPAFASRTISEIFSNDNSFNITAKTVSDRARNPKNQADELELKAIEYFKLNENKDEYFNGDNKDTYQYAYALKIDQKCLKCHGKKENAPKFIREKYEYAYGYKLGEVRGIVSIQLPKKILNDFFSRFFYYSVFYDIVLLLLLFIFIYYLLKKFKSINTILENEVNKKTLELRTSKTNLENLLVTDGLTHLQNRQKLIEDIENTKESKFMHLALLNIDRFKEINDFYGHDVADKVLIEVARLLNDRCNSTNDIVYKLPSDEYAIYTTQEIKEQEFIDKIDEMLQAISKNKFIIDEYSIHISFSCGIASNIFPIMLKADMALQKAKLNHKNIIVYDDTLSVENTIRNNIKGLSLLKKAVRRDQIVPYFQPIYNVENSRIEKYECLARIVKSSGDIITPYFFMDIAMKSKLYPEITKSMVEKSFEFFKDKEYEFSINISIEDIKNIETRNFLIQSLESFPSPNKIVFEILETDEVENYYELKDFIYDIKKYGCQIAIDDFGSGYSNFSRIMELQIDYLKIDASLVKNILTDTNSRKVTQTIINFAKDLGIKTIAEYVEDKESLDLLKEMKTDYIQGYYIGKPQKDI